MAKTIKKLLSSLRKADEDYELIKDGDVIGVGLSGGKDSSLLLYCLYLYQFLVAGTFNKHFKIIGIHIDLNFGEDDFAVLKKWFEPYDITIYEEKSFIADILKRNLKNDAIQCSLCSKLKKGAVIKAAKQLGCNKVAFGHHGDDAIETLLLNMIYGGKIATFDPKMHLTREDITFIRPFIYAFESDLKKALKELDLPKIKSGCPNDGYTQRQNIKELLHKIYHTYPSAKENFLLSLHNKEQLNLFDLKNNKFDK